MKNVIYIISHKRIQCTTVNALLKRGYDGEWYIVADDLDETDYEGRYGKNKVIRFSKEEYANKIDTIDNFKKMTTPVYARNACFDIAKSMEIDCFGLFDDDLTDFSVRIKKEDKLISKKITNLGEIFDIYCEYIYTTGIACGGFVSGGRIIGGVNNQIVKDRFYYNPTNAYIINTNVEQDKFTGTLWEDSIYCYLNNMRGRIVAGMMPVVITMESPGSMKNGGNLDLYSDSNAFIEESYGNIAIPMFFHWVKNGNGHTFSQDVPKILSDRWCKYER